MDVEGKMLFNQTRIILKKQIMSGYVFFAVECLPKVVDEKLKKKKITVSLQSLPPRLIGGENESRIWSNIG